MKWDAQLYDQKHAFVFQYGEEVLQLLDVKPGERILDLGCGTGHLTHLIQQEGAEVLGADSSPDMIAKAAEKYPDVPFKVAHASELGFTDEFDAVFSNAVLHWIKKEDQPAVIASVFKSLKPGGRFVAEMGGQGNVERIIAAVRNVLAAHGYSSRADKSLWFFPSVAEYAALLEENGFRITFMAHFDRDTPLQDQGIIKWLSMFGSQFFEGIEDTDKQVILAKVVGLLEPGNCSNGQWFADYKRLRFVALK